MMRLFKTGVIAVSGAIIDTQPRKAIGRTRVRIRRFASLTAIGTLAVLAPALAQSQEAVRIELNTVENAENRCRMTFVIDNKTDHAFETLKVDFALFNTDGAVYRRMIADMGPLRASKTAVKTFATDGDCAQLGSLLVNEVTACTPGEPNACLDALALSSRIKAVRFYK
jgi:hypothetical protein